MANQYIPRIPEFIPSAKHTAETRIKYYRIAADTTWIELKRGEFFKLVATTDSPCEHICPDLMGGVVWFSDTPTATQRKEYAALCREVERDKKREQRALQCPYKGTAKCDGWKRDLEGNCRCDTCSYCAVSREISLDAPILDEEGHKDSLAQKIPIEAASIDEALAKKERLEQLAVILASLPEDDRKLVIASVQDGMDFGKLAVQFGLSNRNYASKKTGRILERLRKAAQKLDE